MLRVKTSPQSNREWEIIRKAFTRLLSPKRSHLEPVRLAIRDGFQENFDTESAGGIPWARLAPSTAADRRRQGYAPYHPILVRTGGYRDSFVNPSNPDHISKIVRRSDRLQIFEGSDDFRVLWHEQGTRKMPARPVLTISNRAEDNLRLALRSMVAQTLRTRS